MSSPWEVLGLDEGASFDQIKAAHRRLTQLLHPDRYGDAPPGVRAEATRAMQAVNAAYDVLAAAAGRTSERPAAAAIERYRPRNAWERALAPAPARGKHTDLAA